MSDLSDAGVQGMLTLMQEMRGLLSRCSAAPQQSRSKNPVRQPQTSEGRQLQEETVFGGGVL